MLASFAQEVAQGSVFIKKGLYHSYLSRFLKYFKSENVLILIHEDSLADPAGFIKKIYQFLGVDANFKPPSLLQKVNRAVDINYRLPGFNRLVDKRKKVKGSRSGRAVLKFFKAIGLNKLINWLLRANRQKKSAGKAEKPVIDQITRQKLQKFYQEDIKQLEKFLNQDLSFWQ